jgi:hypothetical protein
MVMATTGVFDMTKPIPRAIALLLAATAAGLALVNPASAKNDHMSRVLGSDCFSRTYSAEHLRAHPRQLVTRMQVWDASSVPEHGRKAAGSFRVRIDADLRRGEGVQVGYCRPEAQGAVCDIEGDGGSIRLAPRDDGNLLLRVTERGLSIETDKTVHDLRDSDDRVFLLYRTKQCVH